MVKVEFTNVGNGASNVPASGRAYSTELTDMHWIVQKGSADNFTFNVHYNSSCFNGFKPRISFITASINNVVFFRGRVYAIDTTQENNGTRKIVCEGQQSYLRESFVFGGSSTGSTSNNENENNQNQSNEVDYVNPKAGTSVEALIYELYRCHNLWVQNALQMTVGPVVNLSGLSSVLNNDLSLDGCTVYEALDRIADDIGAEWRAGSGGTSLFQIQFAKRLGRTVMDPPIKTGLSLKSIERSEDATEIFTAIMPFGGVGYDEQRLTLSKTPYNNTQDINGGTTSYSDITIGTRNRPYITNTILTSIYGLSVKPVIYDDIVVNDPKEFKTKRDELAKRAKEDVNKLAEGIITYSADAFDFASAGYSDYMMVPILEVYNYYKVQDYITGYNIKLRLTKKDTNFDDIFNPSLTFELDDRVDAAEAVPFTSQ